MAGQALSGLTARYRSSPTTGWQLLLEHLDTDLQEKLLVAIERRESWAVLVRAKKLAVGLVDLRDPSAPRLSMINGQRTMYAASLPKIAVLYAGVQGFENGSLRESPEIIQDLEAMIRRSSNQAATRVIRELGFEYISTALTRRTVALYDEDLGGGLWVGRAYSKGGHRYPDPVAQVTHGANVYQVCRFYYLLAYGRLVGPERSRQMLDLLSNTSMHHKFVHYLYGTGADLSRVYRKSGTWRQWHSDSMLVWDRADRKYILVAIVEDEAGGDDPARAHARYREDSGAAAGFRVRMRSKKVASVWCSTAELTRSTFDINAIRYTSPSGFSTIATELK